MNTLNNNNNNNNNNNTIKQSVFVVSAYGEIDGSIGGFVAKVTNTEEEGIAYMKNEVEKKYKEWVKNEEKAKEERQGDFDIKVHKCINHSSATVSDYTYGVQNFITYTVGEYTVKLPIVKNAEQNLEVSDKKNKPHKEKRVYVFNINNIEKDIDIDINKMSDDDFIRFAEEDGRIYSSVENFINAFNYNEVSADCDYARVIEVDCYDDDKE